MKCRLLAGTLLVGLLTMVIPYFVLPCFAVRWNSFSGSCSDPDPKLYKPNPKISELISRENMLLNISPNEIATIDSAFYEKPQFGQKTHEYINKRLIGTIDTNQEIGYLNIAFVTCRNSQVYNRPTKVIKLVAIADASGFDWNEVQKKFKAKYGTTEAYLVHKNRYLHFRMFVWGEDFGASEGIAYLVEDNTEEVQKRLQSIDNSKKLDKVF
jgi:hypothetical protein